MKRYFLPVPVFIFIIGAAFAQNAENPISRMDGTIKTITRSIHNKFTEEKAQRIAVGQFSYQGSTTPLGTYWINQLSGELSNISGRSYIILSGGPANADWTISGEIIVLSGIIRIFTRLIRTEDRAVEAAFNSDFERSTALDTMLVSGGGGASSRSSFPDEWEPDGWENPQTCEIDDNERAPVINRTIHESDEDFFLLTPDRNGRITVETTGNTDTYLYLYNYETREELGKDDDGGSGMNARVRYNVQAGTQYLAKVRGYSRDDVGSYGFRVFFSGGSVPSAGEY